MSTTLRRLRVHRTALVVITAFVLVTAGLWTIAAALWGAAIGAGVGMLVGGAALVVLEALTEDGTP